ncbi:DegV family protein [Faecalispora anaeroviscerum]|uniref:DegV family protein n=1 Tax=Faecalispora anaeroviscerum TaxID=2991836 RepID=UPI0024BBA360|nr:DegV family protein [Faecalispora anaeroviscerum]
MSVQILIDSTADLSREEAERVGVRIVPLTVHFGDRQYVDKFTITDKEFYEMLNTEEEMPTTTQVSPQSFLDVYAEYPNDEIVGIYIAQKLSGTYQSAVIAKEECGRDDIYPVDSTTVSAGAALLVREAIRLRDEGKSGKEIAEQITALAKRVDLLAVFNTMKYLVKGGRLSSTKGTLGNLLGIKPIIQVKDGVLEVIGKERGMKKACDFVVRYVHELPDFDSNMPIAYAHSFNVQELPILKQEIGDGETLIMGSVVGTHGGPGTILFAYFRK